MLRLTEEGRTLFEATRNVSLNEIKAIQTIAYEKVTENDFAFVSGLASTEVLTKLREKGFIKGE